MMRQVVSRRRFGSELRRLRLEAGMQQREIADVIECDASQISKVERGERTLKSLELTAILQKLAVLGEEYSAMIAMGEQARKRRPRRKKPPMLPSYMARLSDFEEDATEIFCVSAGCLPDLLQIPEYTRAVAELAACPLRAPLDELLEFAKDRQSILDTRTPLWFGIGEAVLRRPFGGREVLREQLQFVLNATATRPWIRVQVVPATGAPSPLVGKEVIAFRFGPGAEDVIYQPTVIGGGMYWHDEVDTEPCMRAIRSLRGNALGVETSRRLISRCITELTRG